jgi:hypothetical protein
MDNRKISTECVRKLANLDASFVTENMESVCDASEFPHAVMMLFAGHLARRFARSEGCNQTNKELIGFLNNVSEILEETLHECDADSHTVIMDSFIEQLYDENAWLFDQLIKLAKPLLRKEMLTHKTQQEVENGDALRPEKGTQLD